MSEPNPYERPGARVADPPSPSNRRFSWKAVAIGAVTDIGCSTLGGFALVVLFAIVAGQEGQSAEEIVAQLTQSWPFVMVSMIVGGCFTVLGGYVAGRVAGHAFLKHALAAGALSFAIGIAFFQADDGPYSGVIAALGYGLHLPLALLGGWVAWHHAFARSK